MTCRPLILSLAERDDTGGGGGGGCGVGDAGSVEENKGRKGKGRKLLSFFFNLFNFFRTEIFLLVENK